MSRSALSGFLLGSVVSVAVLTFWNRSKSKKSSSKNRDASSETSSSTTTKQRAIPQELRDEQLSRHTLYFGEDGMQFLREAKVVVVGLGGVGSHTVHMLARGGVGHLRLIDFDQVSLSSLNRHACATLADVGTPKATCLKRFCEKLCPDPKFMFMEDMVQMYTKESGPALLEGHDWDLVIDAIDDVPTKAALLTHCIAKGFRVISCMGAGGKSDVTRLHISDLQTASRDPLASKLRQSLKRLGKNEDTTSYMEYMDDMDKLSVVYSSEKTVVKLADFTDEQKEQGVHQFGAVDGMRIRIIPVLGTMPAVMGQTLAALALCELGKKPFSPVTGERVGRNVRMKLHQHLKNRENKIRERVEADLPPPEGDDKEEQFEGRIVNGTWVGPIQIDPDDVEYLLEVWRNRCAITGDKLGTVLELIRWDLSKPSVCRNLVIMGKKAKQRFDATGQASVQEDIREKIEARLRSCRIDSYA
jgi:tRNA A37 threonylcarbamoyladenosine dehydratase